MGDVIHCCLMKQSRSPVGQHFTVCPHRSGAACPGQSPVNLDFPSAALEMSWYSPAFFLDMALRVQK